MQELQQAALRAQDAQLSAFLAGWLERRGPLVNEVANQLTWFVDHPERALEHARGVFRRRSKAAAA